MNKYLSLKFSSPFGLRQNPTGDGMEFHRGIDWIPNENLETWAGLSGRVRLSTFGQREGFFIQIVSEIENMVFYQNLFHNEKLLRNAGDIVESGDAVAIAGTTGNSTGIHIHDEIFTYDIFNKNLQKLRNAGIKEYLLTNENRIFFNPIGIYEYLEAIKLWKQGI